MKKTSTVSFLLVLLFVQTALGKETDMLAIGNAVIHYETAGSGQPIVFIHAGVADSRQWNNEFRSFSQRFKTIRYDMRGFGKSEPVAGEYSHLDDLNRLLDHLNIERSVILVGCSMGGSTALDYALQNPSRVGALVLVGSAPAGLDIDLPTPSKFKLVEEAYGAGNIELVAELLTQIWFDGDRKSSDVNQEARRLAYEMNLTARLHEAKGLGTRLPNLETEAIDQLSGLEVPVLAIVGENDIPYMHAAADVLSTKLSNYRRVTIENAGHLPNLDQPAEFERIVGGFIESTQKQ